MGDHFYFIYSCWTELVASNAFAFLSLELSRTGREVNLKYVDDADLATNKIRVVPKGERETDPGAGSGPDAEDLMVLKRKVVLSSPKNAVGGRAASRNRGTKVSDICSLLSMGLSVDLLLSRSTRMEYILKLSSPNC